MRRLLVAAVVPALAVCALVLPRDGDAALSQAMPPPEAPTGVGDVTGLTPSMRRAVARAIDAARADGVELRVTSGWRSAEHQRRLYESAIAKYGSASVARQWVLPPDESAHVRGEAVDIGPAAGAAWLETYGVRFGLCRRYANEPWHFERLAPAVGSACPALEPHA
ncbi:MAG TPA: M15 family metallopeptidase [Frankiaceae bacterium]|nr:M15 family metallopeptidase [Frankiaceae bacterium]